MKATKKIVGAACALVAATALAAGSTFAWFAENGTVTATGITVDVSTSNAYLIIAQDTNGLSAGNTSLTMAPTGNNGTLKPSAYIATDYNAESDTNKAEGDTWAATTLGNGDTTCIHNVSQWYTGTGKDTNDGHLTGNKIKIKGDDSDPLSDYVVIQDIVISISGTTAVDNVRARMTATITESAKACPIKIVILHQLVESETANSYGELGTWTKVEVDANDGLGTGGNGIDLYGISSPDNYIAVKVLIYMDGNDTEVKTANSGNLSGCSVSFEFKQEDKLGA